MRNKCPYSKKFTKSANGLQSTLITMLILFSFIFSAKAQCTGCTIIGPASGNYTFATGQVVCFTSDATLSDVTFQTGSKVCIAPGVTVIIQNNINAVGDIIIEVYGTLQTNQPVTFNANIDILVASGGLMKGGASGTTNFSLNGPGNNMFINRGTIEVGVMTFSSGSATNVIDNFANMTIHNNINISGTTRFRNNGNLIIGASFNNNSQSNFINCAYFEAASGFNLGGGFVINTAEFRVLSQRIDYGGSTARMENYGTVYVNGVINLGGGSCVYYNEGFTELTSSFQNDGNVVGPTSASKRGYFLWNGKAVMNNGTIGPNLDLKNSSGASTPANMFNNLGGVTISPSVSFDCVSSSNCAASLVTTGAVCRNPDGSLPCTINDPGNQTGLCSGMNDLQFTLNLTGTDVATTYNVVGATPATGSYGSPNVFTIAGGADGTNKIITITDAVNSSCTQTITITGSQSCYTDMRVTKNVNLAAPNVGGNIDFTIVATNLGPGLASDVIVNDILPSGYTFINASPSVGTYVSSTGIWTVGNLLNGVSATLVITAKVKNQGDFLNIATVTLNGTDPDLDNNSAQQAIAPKSYLITNPMIHSRNR